MSSRFGLYFIGYYVGLAILVLSKVIAEGVATFTKTGGINIPYLDYALTAAGVIGPGVLFYISE